MGQKIHPIGFRLGITQLDRSLWFSKRNHNRGPRWLSHYAQYVMEDTFIRKALVENFPQANIADIQIRRNNQKPNHITVIIRAEVAQHLLGYNFNDFSILRNFGSKLKKRLEKYRSDNLYINSAWRHFSNDCLTSSSTDTSVNKNSPETASFDKIIFFVGKVIRPWTQAYSIARFVVESLEKRKRVRCNVVEILTRMRKEFKARKRRIQSISTLRLPLVKQKLKFIKELLIRIEKKYNKDIFTKLNRLNQNDPGLPPKQKVKGIKIQFSGRLNGAEIARTVWSRIGRVPLQTLRANVDYSCQTAKTIYGLIGIKVWVFKVKTPPTKFTELFATPPALKVHIDKNKIKQLNWVNISDPILNKTEQTEIKKLLTILFSKEKIDKNNFLETPITWGKFISLFLTNEEKIPWKTLLEKLFSSDELKQWNKSFRIINSTRTTKGGRRGRGKNISARKGVTQRNR